MNAAVDEASIDAQLLAERYRIIMRQVPRGIVAPVAMAALSLPLFWPAGTHAAIFIALSIMIVAWFGSWYVYRRYRAAPAAASQVAAWVRFSMSLKFLQGVGWGIYGAASFPAESPLLQTLVLAFLFGVVAGSTLMNAPHFRSVLAFALPAMVPIIVRCAISNSPHAESLALAAVIGLAFALSAGHQWERAIIEALRMRFDNLHLLAALEEQKNLAEAANQQKSRFLAAASHDLRQPLHALNLFLEAARVTPEGVERQQIIKRVESAAASLTQLFDGLMELSRLEGGASQPQRRATRLQPLLQNLVNEFRPAATAKGLTLRVRVPDCFVETDPVLCEQILSNLLANAVRYTTRGGVLVTGRPRLGWLWVEVWDTGVGIAPEQQARVFEEFYQVGNAQRDRRQGVGLGLAIVQRLATLLAHPLEVHSRAGRGSRFRLSVPMVDAGDVSGEHGAAPGSDVSSALVGVTIAVIEDDYEAMLALQYILRQSGCMVFGGATAEKVRAQLQAAEREPEIILSDYRLADGVNGAEAIAMLRATFGAEIPALILTGERIAADIAPSALAILQKPVAADTLRRHIASALST